MDDKLKAKQYDCYRFLKSEGGADFIVHICGQIENLDRLAEQSGDMETVFGLIKERAGWQRAQDYIERMASEAEVEEEG